MALVYSRRLRAEVSYSRGGTGHRDTWMEKIACQLLEDMMEVVDSVFRGQRRQYRSKRSARWCLHLQKFNCNILGGRNEISTLVVDGGSHIRNPDAVLAPGLSESER